MVSPFLSSTSIGWPTVAWRRPRGSMVARVFALGGVLEDWSWSWSGVVSDWLWSNKKRVKYLLKSFVVNRA